MTSKNNYNPTRFFVVAVVVRKLPFIPFYCETLNVKPPETAVRKKTLTAVT